MNKYRYMSWTEAQAYAQDGDRRPIMLGEYQQPRIPVTGPTLVDIERDVADLLLKVRGMNTRERWAELATPRGIETATPKEDELIRQVWKAMPGHCCKMDAARLIARKF